jgi:CRISPR/Cas system-associated exonuclease Cas4 (RecB family)
MSFTWSFSALKEYVNCPRQYYEVKVLKRYEKSVTYAMTYGTEVHKACEDYVGQGRPLAKNYQHFQPILDSLLEIEGTRYPEYEMGLYRDGSACAFDDPERYVRGIVDLLIVDGETAYLVDYKTGSNKYPDPKQLKLMALMTFAHFPEVKRIKAGLLFIVHNSFMDEEYSRSQIDDLWGAFVPALIQLETSLETGVWNPNRTPLCSWCPVTTCEFHKVRR